MTKYHNKKKRTADGFLHDSRKEARRWQELQLLERAGEIRDLTRQVRFLLIPAQTEEVPRVSPKTGKALKPAVRTVERECTYIADFVYKRGTETIVEDVKGYRGGTAYDVFSIKRKLMLYTYQIRVKEV